MLEFKEVPAALPSMVRAMIPIGSTLTRSEPNRAEGAEVLRMTHGERGVV